MSLDETTKNYDALVVGWGKAGKTIAQKLALRGQKVALVEASPAMYGGTCINIACVPTKKLIVEVEQALAAKAREAEASSDAAIFAGAQKARNALIEKLNNANYHMVADKGVDIYDGTGEFVGPKTVRVNGEQGTWLLTADTIIINTGARPVVPPIPGVDSKRVVDSTGIQFLPTLPGRLAVVGGGPIGLEYADMFAQLGVQVTVIDAAEAPFTRFDADVASVATDILAKHGVQFVNGAKVASFVENGDGVVVNYTLATPAGEQGENQELAVDYVLLAIGRRPATDGLGLETAGIATGARGEVVVDEFCRTNVPGVFAVGDVNGGPQFTYISLDDYRVVLSQLLGDGSRSTKDRQAVAATIYMNPPLSSVGLTERDALAAGHTIKVAAKPVAAIAAMPRAKTLENPRGIMKFVIDADTDQILGAQLLVVESMEVINLVALAMRHNITASQLRDEIYTHPSITEGLNEVLANAVPVN